MKTIYRISMLDAQNMMQNKTVAVPPGKDDTHAVAAVQQALGVTNRPKTVQEVLSVDIEVS